MRRSIATLLIPLATLAACATAGGAPGPLTGDVGRVSATYSNPMHVRLYEEGSGLVVRVNRPAHTAIFEIFPGQGIALVSPDFGHRELLPAGSTRLFASQLRHRFWSYDNVRSNPYALAAVYSQPRHLLVIASEKPLQTERFRRSPGMLRRALGTASYTSLNSRRVVDDVLAAVVPSQADDSWDADVITVWPSNPGTRLPAGDLYRIRCRNGGVTWVPLELAEAACRNPDRVLPPPAARPDSVRPTEPTDPEDVRKPGGRRPVPQPANPPVTPGTDTREVRLTRMQEDLRSYRRTGQGDEAAAARNLRISELRRDLAIRRSMSTETYQTSRLRAPSARIERTAGDAPRARPASEHRVQQERTRETSHAVRTSTPSESSTRQPRQASDTGAGNHPRPTATGGEP